MAVLRFALLAVWFVLLEGHRVFADGVGPNFARIPPWARMTSSAVLVAIAILGGYLARDTARRQLMRWVSVGMAFGLVGDLLLAGLLGLKGAVALGVGMLAFAIGHAAYLRGTRAVAPFARLPIAIAIAVAVVGWFNIVYGGRSPSPILTGAALVYGSFLGAVAGAMAGLALKDRAFVTMAIGATLFFASDLILSLELFRPEAFAAIPDRFRGDIVWLVYGVGQMMIVMGPKHPKEAVPL